MKHHLRFSFSFYKNRFPTDSLNLSRIERKLCLKESNPRVHTEIRFVIDIDIKYHDYFLYWSSLRTKWKSLMSFFSFTLSTKESSSKKWDSATAESNIIAFYLIKQSSIRYVLMKKNLLIQSQTIHSIHVVLRIVSFIYLLILPYRVNRSINGEQKAWTISTDIYLSYFPLYNESNQSRLLLLSVFLYKSSRFK